MPAYNADDNIDVTYVDYPDSSFVRLIAYDDVSGELYVQLNDYVYVYGGVMEDVYHAFKDAPSAGSFYDTSVKGVYKSQYVGEKDDYGFATRPIALPEAPVEVTPVTGLLTDPGVDKQWFNVSYTVTSLHQDTVISRGVEEALEILKRSLESEGVENYVVTSITPAK